MANGFGLGKKAKFEMQGFCALGKLRGGRMMALLLVFMVSLCMCATPVSGRMSARVRRERAREAAAKAVEAQKRDEAKQAQVQPRPTVSVPVSAPFPVAAALPAPVPVRPAPCDEVCQQGRLNLELQRRLAWFSGGLVLVGLLQVGALAWQGWLLRRTRDGVDKQGVWLEAQAGVMREQTGILKLSVAAAQTSADAALKQISHAVVSERPWMEVQLAEKELNFGYLKFMAQNRGSSPAKVTMYAVEKVMVTAEDAAGGPKYGNHGRFDEVEWSQWKLSGDQLIVGEFQLPPTLSSEVRQPGVCVLYQGVVRYHDTLTEDLHETRFCYEAFAPEEGAVRFRMFPAKGYNAMS